MSKKKKFYALIDLKDEIHSVIVLNEDQEIDMHPAWLMGKIKLVPCEIILKTK